MSKSKDRFLRLSQIIPDILPIGKSTFWERCRDRTYPSPIKLGPKTTVWKASEIYALVDKLGKKNKVHPPKKGNK